MRPSTKPWRPIVPGVLAAALLTLSIAWIGLTRLQAPVPITSEPSSAVAVRNLRFQDQADGGIVVTDADTGLRVTTIAPRTGEFIRITMRGLAHARKRSDADQSVPFRLTYAADGRLTLKDPATGRLIELEAFGETNAGAFAQLLAAPENAS